MAKNFGKITPWRFFGMFIVLESVLAFYVYRDYLLLDKLFLFKDVGSDTINYYYPRWVHIADYLRTDGLPRWSFNSGMGQSLLPNSIGIPFDWPLFALGSNRLAYGIAYLAAFKAILGGAIFYLYLRLVSPNVYVCMVGGLLYAFSGFMILGGSWYIFSTEAVYLALLLYAFERYLQQGVWWPFPLVIALVASSYSFDLYTHAVFLVFYGVLRYHDCHGWHSRAMGYFFLRLAGLGLMGAGIASIFLFANMQEILQSHRISGKAAMDSLLQGHAVFSFADRGANIVALMRAFSSNMTGAGSNYQGMNNYLEDPMFYCGLINLLLAPQVFIFLGKRQRILYGALALVFILPVAFPYFRYAFWLFSGDYHRVLSLFTVLAAVLFSLKALGNIMASGRLGTRLLVGTLAVLLGGLLYPYEILAPDPILKWTTAGFLCLYTLLIVGISQEKTRAPAAALLLVALCVELAMTASMTVNDRPVVTDAEFHERIGYNDYSVDAINYLKKNDNSFYRIEKTYASSPTIHFSLNEGMAQSYWGTSSYESFNKDSYLDFADAMGLISEIDNRKGRRWIKGLRERPILLAFASVKYMLTKNPAIYTSFGFRTFRRMGDIFMVQNLSALPFGFTYDSYISHNEFMRLAEGQKDSALIKAVVLDPPLEAAAKGRYQRLLAGDIGDDFKMQQFITDVQARQKHSLEIASFSQNNIIGKITLEQDRMLFFTIPFDNGWKAKVDGMPAELLRVNIGFTGLMVAPGSHTIELTYQPTYWVAGWIVSTFSLLAFLFCLWRNEIRLAVGNSIKWIKTITPFRT